MRHGQDQRQVGAGLDGHPLVGVQAAVVVARVDHHDMDALGMRVAQLVQRGRADAVGVAAAQEHDHVGVGDVGGEVGGADGLGHAGVLGHVAGHAVGVHVRGAERVHEALGVVAARRTRILDHDERLRTVGRDDGLRLLGDLAERLIPADRLELALVVLLQRIGEAVLRPCDRRVAVAARAQRAVAVRMVSVAHHLGEAAVLAHVRGESALGRAGVAQRVHGLLLAGGVGLLGLPGGKAQKSAAGSHRGDSRACRKEASPGDRIIRHRLPLLFSLLLTLSFLYRERPRRKTNVGGEPNEKATAPFPRFRRLRGFELPALGGFELGSDAQKRVDDRQVEQRLVAERHQLQTVGGQPRAAL